MEVRDIPPQTERPSWHFFAQHDGGTWWKILAWGLATGAIVFVLSSLIERFIAEPLLCRSVDSFSMCSNAGAIAFNIGTVLSAVIGTIGLVKLSTYRPLLIAIVSAATLWGLQGAIHSLAWGEALLWLAGMYAVTYGLFAWILRMHHFPTAFIAAIAIVIAARLVLNA
ncbi:MAG TPA: hypothetical protein VFZ48_03215 [Candidatus Saccharimonadales bacterium]